MIESLDSPFINEGTAENFPQLVLANSEKGPVLANFWSKKAGPSLRQYPVLDALVHRYQGRFLLVNIDTDREIKLTKVCGVISVPTLQLYRKSVIVETMHGYQSEADLVKRLDQYVARDSDQALAGAVREYAQGNQKRAYEIIADAILQDPDNPRLPLALCKLLKHEQRFDEAARLLDTLPGEMAAHREIRRLHDELYFLKIAHAIEDIDTLLRRAQESEDLEVHMRLSAYYIANQQHELALQHVLKITEADQAFNDGYARRALMWIFKRLGDDHELVKKHRAMLLRYAH